MKSIFPSLLLSALVSLPLCSFAEDAAAANVDTAKTQAQMQTMQQQVQTMQAQMQAMMTAKTPEERQAAMQAHMKTMQEHMQSMHQMAGCTNGQNCMGGTMGSHMQGGGAMMGDCMGAQGTKTN